MLVLAVGLTMVAVERFGDASDSVAHGGAVLVGGVLSWAVAARVAGRAGLFGAVGLLFGAAAVVLDQPELRSGAAVLTATAGAVLGVLLTRSTTTVKGAAREVLIAIGVGFAGAGGAVGFQPSVDPDRLRLVVVTLAVLVVSVLVYRLGPGWQRPGPREVGAVALGVLLLAVFVTYGELLRRYGTPGLVDWLGDLVTWCHDHLGGFPRPLQAFVGIPALIWGSRLRVRSLRGWWVSAFGVAATSPPAYLLLHPSWNIREVIAAEVYSLLIGILIGAVILRVDTALFGATGNRARRSTDRQRTEPGRFAPLW